MTRWKREWGQPFETMVGVPTCWYCGAPAAHKPKFPIPGLDDSTPVWICDIKNTDRCLDYLEKHKVPHGQEALMKRSK